MGGVTYRVRQFVDALFPKALTEAQLEQVRAVLNEDAYALYQSMPLGDRQHSLAIYDGLVGQGYTARPVLQAALLHDVAKRNLGLGTRSLVVLMNRLSPKALRRVASPDPRSRRYPFYVSLHHPSKGAEMAEKAGVDAKAVILIRAHQAKQYPFAGSDAAQLQEWHRALQALDDVN